MRAKLKTESGHLSLELPPAAAAALAGTNEADVLVLKDGLLLVSAAGVLDRLAAESKIPGSLSSPALHAPALSDEEAALLRKLSAVKFEERTPPAMDKILSSTEKKVVTSLLSRRLITLFTNAKYPKGVYNISQAAYLAGIHSAPGKTFSKTSAITPPLPSRTTPAALQPPAAAPPSRSPLPPGAPAINTVEHLITLGYMVLDNENDAKRVMPDIQSKLKNDDVKGIRGFDKRYYVLRRSFLMEYEGPILALVDQGPASADELGAKLNLTGEAARVLLMILGDAGEVIEKRRGNWVRA